MENEIVVKKTKNKYGSGEVANQEKKDEFVEMFKKYITRDGADKLLAYLESSDFFIAPASISNHLDYPGGLCEHSLNVFYRLKNYIINEYKEVKNAKCPYTVENIAIVSLLHDLCKIHCCVQEKKNKSHLDEQGNRVWEEALGYNWDENLIYGHGEKSVYMIMMFMQLKPIEAQAIRYHMSNWNGEKEGRDAAKAFSQNTLAFYLHVADEAATYIDEKR